jgi:hypothetical protein
LRSIVTSMKPPAFGSSHIRITHRGIRHHHGARLRRQQPRRQIGGGTGVQQHMIIDRQPCIDRERESRRSVNAADSASIDVAVRAFAIMLC